MLALTFFLSSLASSILASATPSSTIYPTVTATTDIYSSARHGQIQYPAPTVRPSSHLYRRARDCGYGYGDCLSLWTDTTTSTNAGGTIYIYQVVTATFGGGSYQTGCGLRVGTKPPNSYTTIATEIRPPAVTATSYATQTMSPDANQMTAFTTTVTSTPRPGVQQVVVAQETIWQDFVPINVVSYALVGPSGAAATATAALGTASSRSIKGTHTDMLAVTSATTQMTTIIGYTTTQLSKQVSTVTAMTATRTITPSPNVVQVEVVQTQIFRDWAPVDVVSYAVIGPAGATGLPTSILGTSTGLTELGTRTVTSVSDSLTTATPIITNVVYSTQLSTTLVTAVTAMTVTKTLTPSPNVQQVEVVETRVWRDYAPYNVVSYALVGPSGAPPTLTSVLGTSAATSIIGTRTDTIVSDQFSTTPIATSVIYSTQIVTTAVSGLTAVTATVTSMAATNVQEVKVMQTQVWEDYVSMNVVSYAVVGPIGAPTATSVLGTSSEIKTLGTRTDTSVSISLSTAPIVSTSTSSSTSSTSTTVSTTNSSSALPTTSQTPTSTSTPISTTPPPIPTVTSIVYSTRHFAAQESDIADITVTQTSQIQSNVQQIVVAETDIVQDFAQFRVASYAVVGPSGAAPTQTIDLGTTFATTDLGIRTITSGSTVLITAAPEPTVEDQTVTETSTYTPPTVTVNPITVTMTTDVTQVTTLGNRAYQTSTPKTPQTDTLATPAVSTPDTETPTIQAIVTWSAEGNAKIVATSTVQVFVQPTAFLRGYHLDGAYIHRLAELQEDIRRREMNKRC